MIRVRCLGQCVIEVGDHRVTPESDVLFAVLLVLSRNAGRPVPRAELLELLWPDRNEGTARHRLRQAVYQIKKMGAPLATPEAAVCLGEGDVIVDCAIWQRDPAALLACLAERRFDFLPHYAPAFSVPFARWVEAERDRVRREVRQQLLGVIVERQVRGDHGSVIAYARGCLVLDPLNPGAICALAEALALRGDIAEALATIDRYGAELSMSNAVGGGMVEALRRRIVLMGRRDARAAAAPPTLVGRGELVREIASWLGADRNRGSRVLALTGEAGIGKTRLLNEGGRIAAVRGIRCVEYRASANGGDRPLAGLLDLLPQLLGLPGAVGCMPDSYARLSALARGVQIDPSIPEDTTESAFRYATLRRSVLDLVDAVLVESNVVLLLDDAHSLDRQTLEILLDATRGGGAHRLSLLVGMRAVGTTATLLEARAEVQVVRVPRLEPAAARLIVTQRLAPNVAAERARLVDWAVDLANGNPFFLVELSAHCGGDSPSHALPESLQTALERKLDALSPTARLFVQACAILGQNSTLSRVETLLGLPPHAVAGALAELESAGLIVAEEARVMCRHELIADAVVRGIGPGLGAYLHRRCATVLDRETASSTASLAWDCAAHWDAAGEHDRALELTGTLIEHLLALGLPQEAAELCLRAKEYCRTAVQHSERLRRLARARRLLYDWDGMVSAIEERRAVLADGGLPSESYSEDDISVLEARWWRDCDGRVLRPIVRAVTAPRAPTLYRLQMAVLGLIVADNRHLRKEAERIVSVVEHLDTATPREDLEKTKARLVYHSSFGDVILALELGTRLLEGERRGGSSASFLRALRWVSVPMRRAGNVDAAIAVLAEAYDRASRLGLRGEMWNVAYHMSWVALDSENLELATQWGPVCEGLAGDATVFALRTSTSAEIMARTALMRGDTAKAWEFLKRSQNLRTTTVQFPRLAYNLLALELYLRSRGGSKIPVRKLARLRQLHVRYRDVGVHDFEAAALTEGLIKTGGYREAEDLLEYYLRTRRSRSPLPTTLVHVQRMLAGDRNLAL